jgi:Putative rhamnosyl transferase
VHWTAYHLVATRFNLTVEFATGRHLDPAWLRSRVRLFGQFCAPSIAAQTAQGFDWAVFVDPNTPDVVRGQLEEIVADRSRSLVLPWSGSVAAAVRAVVDERRAGAAYVITSRLDSDDALERTYVERVQAAGASTRTRFIDLPVGYTYNPVTNVLRQYEEPTNPFVSLIEPWSPNMHTVYATWHTKVHELAPVTVVSEEAAWMQVVHGGNVSNREHGDPVPGDPAAVLLRDFGVASHRPPGSRTGPTST